MSKLDAALEKLGQKAGRGGIRLSMKEAEVLLEAFVGLSERRRTAGHLTPAQRHALRIAIDAKQRLGLRKAGARIAEPTQGALATLASFER